MALHRLLIDDIDLPAARELWSRLWPLCSFLEAHSYAAAVKTACALAGDTTGPVRAPLLPLDDAATAELGRLLEQLTDLLDDRDDGEHAEEAGREQQRDDAVAAHL